MNLTSDIVVNFLKQNNIDTKYIYVRCDKIIGDNGQTIYCNINVTLNNLALNQDKIQEILDKQFTSNNKEEHTRGFFNIGDNTVSVRYRFRRSLKNQNRILHFDFPCYY